MKRLHKQYPFWFGLIFLLLYGILDYTDAKWFIPRMAGKDCNIDATCEWYKDNTKDENDHLQSYGFRVPKRGPKTDMDR